ncbi:hypothetical protein KDA82_37080, partial [Streptomyces daliensis]|nr:hypothetical protein [Streptomyces daliensis]
MVQRQTDTPHDTTAQHEAMGTGTGAGTPSAPTPPATGRVVRSGTTPSRPAREEGTGRPSDAVPSSGEAPRAVSRPRTGLGAPLPALPGTAAATPETAPLTGGMRPVLRAPEPDRRDPAQTPATPPVTGSQPLPVRTSGEAATSHPGTEAPQPAPTGEAPHVQRTLTTHQPAPHSG